MRRIRTLIVFVAVLCAVFAGSSTVNAGSGATASPARTTVVQPLAMGKRW